MGLLLFNNIDRDFPGGAVDARASLVAQLVKNLPAMQETWVRFLSQEKKMATHSSILAWESPWTEELGYSPWGHKELDTTE